MISDRDVAIYQEQGYILVEDVLDSAQLDAARHVIDGILASAKGSVHFTVIGVEIGFGMIAG